jgi:hypothetical protein
VAVRLVVPGYDDEQLEAGPVLLGEPQRALAGTEDLTLVLPGRGSTVDGRVVSAATGRPLPAFVVSFIEYWKGLVPRGSETLDVRDETGGFGYELDEGDWAVEITAPGHASHRTRVFRAGSRPTWSLGTIRLGPGGRLRGAIRDAGGDAVAYARLYLLGPQMQTNRRPIFTDAEGSYEASSMAPGTYTVFVLSPRHPLGIVRNVVIAENETSPLDVRLDRPSPVTVTVTDEAGEPVAGADVSYTCDALFPLTSRLLRSRAARLGRIRDGRAQAAPQGVLPAGRVLFSVNAPGFEGEAGRGAQAGLRDADRDPARETALNSSGRARPTGSRASPRPPPPRPLPFVCWSRCPRSCCGTWSSGTCRSSSSIDRIRSRTTWLRSRARTRRTGPPS